MLIALAGGVLTLMPAIAPAAAQASSTYWVEACGPLASNAFGFSTSDNLNEFSVSGNCGVPNTGGFGIGITDNVDPGADPTAEPDGAQASWSLTAPHDETFTMLSYVKGQFTSNSGWQSGWLGGNSQPSAGLTTSLDPGQAFDCNTATPQSPCSRSNSLFLNIFSNVGPLTNLGLGITCDASSCPLDGSAGATVQTADVELTDPQSSVTVENQGGTLGTTHNGFLNNSASWIGPGNDQAGDASLSYTAYDPGGVCQLQAELVAASGKVVAAQDDDVTPIEDGTSGYFGTMLPCGSADRGGYTWAPNFSTVATGSYQLEVVSSNPGEYYAGSTATTNLGTVNVDNSAPTVSVTTSASSGVWYSNASAPVIAVNASDAYSGVASVTCTGPALPGGQETIAATELPARITETSGGADSVSCYATSNAGDVSSPSSATVDVDPQTPTVTLSGAQPVPAVLASAGDVTVNGAEAQSLSGIASTTCTTATGGGAPQRFTSSGASATVHLSGDGTNVVSCYSTTNAGVNSSAQTESVQIDDQQPVVTFTGAAAAPVWLHGSQTVTATGAEPSPAIGFGVASVSCRLDGGAFSTATTQRDVVTIAGNGTHTVDCYATSAAGVAGPGASEKVQIDDQPPSATVSNGPSETTWQTGAQSVTVTATASGGATMQAIICTLNGVATTYPNLDPNATTQTVVVAVPPPGGDLSCVGKDSASSVSAAGTWHFQIDDKPPTGHFEQSDPSNPDQVAAQLADTGSGLATATIEIDVAHGWRALPTRFDPATGRASAGVPDDGSLPDGTYALRALATDRAGNRATVLANAGGGAETVTLPLRAPTELDAVLSGGGRNVSAVAADTAGRGPARSLTLRYGQTSQISGRLVTDRGVPVSRQRITVEQMVSGSNRTTVLGTARTDLGGEFVFRIPAGPTRTLMVAYPGSAALRASRASSLEQVDGQSTIRIGARVAAGHPLTVAGALQGGFIAGGGVLVQLWYRTAGGGGWSPFEHAIRTDRLGRWSIRFPVSPRAAGYTYGFKAVVATQTGWAYLGTSTAVLTRHVR